MIPKWIYLGHQLAPNRGAIMMTLSEGISNPHAYLRINAYRKRVELQKKGSHTIDQNETLKKNGMWAALLRQ